MAASLDLRFLVRLLAMAIGAGVLGAVGAFAATYLVQPTYRASVLMVPSEADSSLLGTSGGAGWGAQSIASLVGLGGQSDSVDKGLAILRSRSFCEDFIEPQDRRNLLETEWRARKRPSVFPSGKFVSTETLCGFFTRSVLVLAIDQKTRFVTLSIRMTDREEAAQWANHLAVAVNERMRQAAAENATTTLEYLGKELSTATTVELRGAIARAMEAQVRVKAFAVTMPSYIFSVVDQAVAPDEGRFEFPRRLLSALGGGVLAGFIAAMVLLVRRRS